MSSTNEAMHRGFNNAALPASDLNRIWNQGPPVRRHLLCGGQVPLPDTESGYQRHMKINQHVLTPRTWRRRRGYAVARREGPSGNLPICSALVSSWRAPAWPPRAPSSHFWTFFSPGTRMVKSREDSRDEDSRNKRDRQKKRDMGTHSLKNN
jgi:hypothetical protein